MAASIFVEFEKKESAEKAVEKSDQFSYEGETISVSIGFDLPCIERAFCLFCSPMWCLVDKNCLLFLE